VAAELQHDNNQIIHAGLEKGRESTKIRFNGQKITRRSEQAQNIPLFAISPETQRLLHGTPRERRHWLDWSLFHVEPSYMENWKSYHYALRQRNVLLRKNANNGEFEPWEETMAQAGAWLHAARKIYIQSLVEQARKITQGKTSEIQIRLETGTGAETADAIKISLRRQRNTDKTVGHTRAGVHRDEVVFTICGKNAAGVMSRGESKLFVLFLFIAQAAEYQARKSLRPVMLIDDLGAELDETACARFFSCLQPQGLQLFVTATQPGLFPESAPGQRMFHVEHGRIVKVLE
jgi:DNA replication and repair protein RecF